MTPLQSFPPTLKAAISRMTSVNPSDYAATRNALNGAVTRLSPYITHGFVSLPQVLAQVAERHALGVQHKLVFELGWREYFHHVWHHQGDGIFESMRPGPLPDCAYARELPADIRQARTGVPVIDEAVRALYATGYLHNHARLWLASYVVHLRKVHWRVGADWLVSHLLDGDLASNHLSWQWVAGTGSSKPYLFNADNVARYAPPAWHSGASVLDTSYDTLEQWAYGARPIEATLQEQGEEEPALMRQPPNGLSCEVVEPGRPSDAVSALVLKLAGKTVWLVHPWALGEPPSDLPVDTVRLGWWPSDHHRRWPWREARWHFVSQRMSELTELSCHTDSAGLIELLKSAQSVQTVADPHVLPYLPAWVQQRESMRLFAHVDRPCQSFSAWWRLATRGVRCLEDLPGLAQHMAHQGVIESLFVETREVS